MNGGLDAVGLPDVSRETIERLEKYAALLKKWNRAINLVSKTTIPDVWRRHFLDSAQIIGEISTDSRLMVDLGSGAGFPGLVVSAIAKELHPELEAACIESDQRKAAFLNTVIRELDLSARVVCERIENVPGFKADTVVARALAPVHVLLGHADRHLKPGGQAVFLKGAGFAVEVDAARSEWVFDFRAVPSKTEQEGAILVFGDIRRA